MELAPSPRQISDLLRIAEIEPAALEQIGNLFYDQSNSAAKIADLIRQTSQHLNHEISSVLVANSISLAILCRRQRIDSTEVVSAVEKGLAKSQLGNANEKTSIDHIRDEFARIIDSPIIKRLAKATDLSFDFTNLFGGVRILTDVRPVFDDDKSSWIGSIVTPVLKLEYSNDEGQTSLSVALSENDVNDIEKEVQEAKKKLAHLKHTLSEEHRSIVFDLAQKS